MSLYHDLEYEVTSNNSPFSSGLQNLCLQGWNHIQSQPTLGECCEGAGQHRAGQGEADQVRAAHTGSAG